MTCGSCQGACFVADTATGNRIECTRCGGSGRRGLNRCPRSMMTRDVEQLVHAVSMFEETGALPVRGALLDQSSRFHEGMRVFRAERSRAAEEKAEIDRRIKHALGGRSN